MNQKAQNRLTFILGIIAFLAFEALLMTTPVGRTFALAALISVIFWFMFRATNSTRPPLQDERAGVDYEELSNMAHNAQAQGVLDETVVQQLEQLKLRPDADYRIAGLASEAIGLVLQYQDQEQEFRQVLDQKFQPTELTYGRYAAAVTEVTELVQQHADQIPTVLRSAIQTDELQERRLAERLVNDIRKLAKGLSGLTAELTVLNTDARGDRSTLTALGNLEDLRNQTVRYGTRS